MAGWELLADIGAFRFEAAQGVIDDEIDRAREYLGDLDDDARDEFALTTDLTLLGAAALQAAVSGQQSPSERPVGPVAVLPSLCRLSFLKFACSLTMVHSHRNVEQLTINDIVPLSGDVAKFAAVDAGAVSQLADEFEPYFAKVVDLYLGSPSPLTRAYADNGWLHLEGLVWRVTLQRLSDPADLPRALDRYVAQFGDQFAHLRRLA